MNALPRSAKSSKREDPMSAVTHAPRRTQDAPTGRPAGGLFDPAQLVRSLPDALRKLDPRSMARSPVMFVVLVGSVLTTVLAVLDPTDGFGWAITAWLWLTTLFANLAEAVAEGRGKAQADTLRKARTGTVARRVVGPNEERVPGTELRVGDLVVCEAGDLVPGDGDVVDGVASVDESAITGESAPVIRESGGDRSAVTGGTKVLSDRIVVKITARPGETFIDRMIGLVEGAARQKTPNEIALNILLASLTVVFLLAVVTLQPFSVHAGSRQSMTVLTALLVCLIPTTIGALLSAIGIAGMDRLVQRNVLAMSGRAVEAAGDVSTLLLDKTGTITVGSRQAAEFLPVDGVTEGISPQPPGSRRWSTRRPRAARSWHWRRSSTVRAYARRTKRSCPARHGWSSPRRPGCPAWTSPAAGCVRERPVPSSPGSPGRAAPCLPTPGR